MAPKTDANVSPGTDRLQLDIRGLPDGVTERLRRMAFDRRVTVTALCRDILVASSHPPVDDFEPPPWGTR